MKTITNGPVIAAMGWLDRTHLVSYSFSSSRASNHRAPIWFDKQKKIIHRSLLQHEELVADLPPSFLKSSKVSRARNAAKSTIFAANLAHALFDHIPKDESFEPDMVAINVSANSATTAVCWDFEIDGVTRGWEKTNTMLLPSSIPSAISTQISASLNIHASAVTFMHGILGFYNAIEHTYLMFHHNRADHCLVLGAEEFCQVQLESTQKEGKFRKLVDGASGILLSKKSVPGGWKIALCGNVAPDTTPNIPESWQNVTRLEIDFLDSNSLGTATLLPYALHQLMISGQNKGLIHCNLSRLGQFVLGLEKENY